MLVKEGFKVVDICKALNIPRSSFYTLVNLERDTREKSMENLDDRYIIDKITQIIAEHPFWGYRRVCAWLNHREDIKINKKRVYRIMKENKLCLNNQQLHKAKRKIDTSKPRATRPNQWWGIDMTKFLIPSIGWVYFVVLLDWFNKKVLGWHVGLQARSKEWIQVLQDAVMSACPEGSREYQINLMSDNGSQPTSTAFMKECGLLGIKQAFTSYDNPKGNAETERFIRTIKEELIWVVEFETLEQAKQMIGHKIEKYNSEYVHSTLGYLSPNEFTQKWIQQNTLIIAD